MKKKIRIKDEKKNSLKLNNKMKKYRTIVENNKLLYFIYFISIFISYLKLSSSIHEITIKLRGTGKQKIFQKSCINGRPYEVIMNDMNITSNIITSYYNNYNYISVNATNEENIIKMKFSYLKQSCAFFLGLTNVTEIDLSKINYIFINMGCLFEDCHSLIYVNFTNLNTTENYNIGTMFKNCYSLSSIDLSVFDTSNVNHMDNLFANCYSLTSINITHFDTSKVSHTDNMFLNCISLKSLDLSNFDTSQNTNMADMFKNCS